MMRPHTTFETPAALVALWVAVAGCADGASPAPRDVPKPDALELPGAMFYPESIAATRGNDLYVGSLGTGQIVHFAPGASTPEVLVAAGTRGVTGLLVMEAENALYACSVDLASLLSGMPESEVHEYDLTSGALRASFPLESPAFCNDFASDADGAVYVTDSFVKVYRRALGADSFELWTSEPQLAPSTPSGFGGDGIVVDGSTVYVNTFTDGKLVAIPRADDGSAGPGVTVTLDRPLAGPDAMRRVGADELIVVNGLAGELVQLRLDESSASTTLIAADLDQPSSVAVTEDSFWVTEGQIGYLFGAVSGEPSLPFTVVRLDR